MKDWTWKRKATVLLTVFAVTFAITSSFIHAEEYVVLGHVPFMGSCINSSYLKLTANIVMNGSTTTVVADEIYCPEGCVNDSNRYGSECAGDAVTCQAETLPFMGFGPNFTLALGLMLMLVGVGVCADVIIRHGERNKKNEMYSV